MPEYIYRCPVHGKTSCDFPMGTAPPTVLCSICKRECKRDYQVVPIQYHSSGFTRSLSDRPDERLDWEIKHSQDFDATTGLSWEETDKKLEERKSRGLVRKKQIELPKAKGA